MIAFKIGKAILAMVGAAFLVIAVASVLIGMQWNSGAAELAFFNPDSVTVPGMPADCARWNDWVVGKKRSSDGMGVYRCGPGAGTVRFWPWTSTWEAPWPTNKVWTETQSGYLVAKPTCPSDQNPTIEVDINGRTLIEVEKLAGARDAVDHVDAYAVDNGDRRWKLAVQFKAASKQDPVDAPGVPISYSVTCRADIGKGGAGQPSLTVLYLVPRHPHNPSMHTTIDLGETAERGKVR